MNIFDPKLSFGIVNSRQFLQKLEEDLLDFESNDTSARHAINCAITSFHLIDWTFMQYFKNGGAYLGMKPKKAIESYRSKIFEECEDLKYMEAIANGSKHCIRENDPNRLSGLSGDFDSPDFDARDFYNKRFTIDWDDEIIDFKEKLVATIQFWRNYIQQCEEAKMIG